MSNWAKVTILCVVLPQNATDVSILSVELLRLTANIT